MVVTGTGADNEDISMSSNVDSMWCDTETHRFYRDLPELQAFLPTSYINKTQPPQPEETSTVTEEALDSELPVELEEDGKKLKLVKK